MIPVGIYFFMDYRKRRILKILLFIAAIAAVLAAVLWNLPERQAESSGFAMDTLISVKLYGGKDPEASLTPVISLFSDTEQTISRYDADSDISKLNRGETLAPEEWFMTLLEKNLEIREETEGLFDPACGPLVDLWNIGSGSERVPEASEIADALEQISGSSILISGDTVSFGPGTIADLGASGKGAVLDRIRGYLEGTDLRGAVVSAGGSVLLYGSRKGKRPFTVAVRDPDGGVSDYLGILKLSGCFVSTSGDYERYFTAGGKRYHHILSAKDGCPADTGLRSVTVVCEDGALSDILSTAVFLSGKERGLRLLEAHQAEGVLVSDDGTVTVTQGLSSRFDLTADGYTLKIYEGIHETR